jgi:hypothetical protein
MGDTCQTIYPVFTVDKNGDGPIHSDDRECGKPATWRSDRIDHQWCDECHVWMVEEDVVEKDARRLVVSFQRVRHPLLGEAMLCLACANEDSWGGATYVGNADEHAQVFHRGAMAKMADSHE